MMSFKALLSTLLSFSLFSLTLAAKTLNNHGHNNQNDAWKYGTGGGVVGFVILILDIIVWSKLLSRSMMSFQKASSVRTKLICVCSGGSAVHSPTIEQSSLVRWRFHVSGWWYAYLLVVQQSGSASEDWAL